MRPSKGMMKPPRDERREPAKEAAGRLPSPEELLSRRRDAIRKAIERTRQASKESSLEKAADEAVDGISRQIRGRPEGVPRGHLAVRLVGVEKAEAGGGKEKPKQKEGKSPKARSDRVPLGGLAARLTSGKKIVAEVQTDAGGVALFQLEDLEEPLLLEALAPDEEVLARLRGFKPAEEGRGKVLEISYAPSLEAAFSRGRALLESEECARQKAAEIKETVRCALDNQQKLLERSLEQMGKGPER